MMLAIITLGFVLVVFKLKEQHGLYIFPTFGSECTSNAYWSSFYTAAECLHEAGETNTLNPPPPWKSHYRQVLRTKSVHFLSIFLVVYSSIELTITSECCWSLH